MKFEVFLRSVAGDFSDEIEARSVFYLNMPLSFHLKLDVFSSRLHSMCQLTLEVLLRSLAFDSQHEVQSVFLFGFAFWNCVPRGFAIEFSDEVRCCFLSFIFDFSDESRSVFYCVSF